MNKNTTNQKQTQKPRTPIVTVLGHVDHGKTTLLDSIRDTRVQAREAGGITQATGSSKIKTKEGKSITFIDTPGHAAFNKMRERGANVADIAVLVVAANDGVKPQTQEALRYILDVKVPFIVAITKIDLPSISIEKAKSQLTKDGVKFEGEGGDTPVVLVSGKTGKGIDELLEMINLLAEVNDVSEDTAKNLEGYIIETNIDKSGPVVSMVIKNGTLNVGDEIVSDGQQAKVRAIFDSESSSVKSIGSGEGVLVLGFKDLPSVGSKVVGYGNVSVNQTSKANEGKSAENEEADINIILKAKSNGSLEAILANLPEGVNVVSSGVGDVTESDLFLAKSIEDKLIFVFEAKVPTNISKLAATEDVTIERFDIVYKLFERLSELIKSEEEIILGEANILTTFPFNSKKVAGCKISKGRIDKSDTLILMRDEDVLGKVKITSMKKVKSDIQNAKEGEELGIIFAPQLDFKPGDVLISVRN
jgi:translation initiation factor IF-2